MAWMRVVLLLAAVGMCAQAQMPRGMFAWWESPVVKDLNLSVDQQSKVREAVRESRRKLVDLRANAERAEIDVEEAFNEEPVNAPKATEAINRLAAARADLTRELTLMSLKLRSVLTAQQWQELQRRRPARQLQEGLRERRMPKEGPGPRN